MLAVYEFDEGDLNALHGDIAWFRRVAPEEAGALSGLQALLHDPHGCDNPAALACTGGRRRLPVHERVAVLPAKYSSLRRRDRIIRIWHEGAHWEPDGFGGYQLRPHTDESSPDRHMRDWLYGRQRALEAKLAAAEGPSVVEQVAKGVAIGTAVVGVSALTVVAADVIIDVLKEIISPPRRPTRRR